MFRLRFNKTEFTKQELTEIEQSFKQNLKQEQDMFKVNVLSMNRTDLYGHLMSLFVLLNVHKTLNMNSSQLLDFLIDVANEYTTAPYHTFYHASDVVTMLYYFCHDLNAEKYLSDLDKAFLMVAALCHDIGHPGFTNTYQVNAKTDLVQRFGDQSTLEIYSVDLTIQLLNKHKLNAKHDTMNDVIRDLILSTDMVHHANLENEANDLLTQPNSISLCRVLLHAADISNMVRPWVISKQWSDLIVQEFFTQGDEEKKRNITISPGMDRELFTQQKISLNFGKLIQPYFKSIVSLLPRSHVLVEQLASNRIQWECLEPKKKLVRRVSQQDCTKITAPIRYKRIRLGNRSQSYPTVLYSSSIIEKSNILPILNLRSYSLCNENIESNIVLVHPYDK